MSTVIRKPVKLYMIQPDGVAIDLEGVAIQLDINSYPQMPEATEWTLTVEGVGNPTWMSGEDIAGSVASRIKPDLWECEFCQHGNLYDHLQCQFCGWYRGVIVETVNTLKERGVWQFR